MSQRSSAIDNFHVCFQYFIFSSVLNQILLKNVTNKCNYCKFSHQSATVQRDCGHFSYLFGNFSDCQSGINSEWHQKVQKWIENSNHSILVCGYFVSDVEKINLNLKKSTLFKNVYKTVKKSTKF